MTIKSKNVFDEIETYIREDCFLIKYLTLCKQTDAKIHMLNNNSLKVKVIARR